MVKEEDEEEEQELLSTWQDDICVLPTSE